jgi:hypothetical protein
MKHVFNIIGFGNVSVTKWYSTCTCSGIAATLLEGGRTAHSALKLLLNMQINEKPTCKILRNYTMTKALQQNV